MFSWPGRQCRPPYSRYSHTDFHPSLAERIPVPLKAQKGVCVLPQLEIQIQKTHLLLQRHSYSPGIEDHTITIRQRRRICPTVMVSKTSSDIPAGTRCLRLSEASSGRKPDWTGSGNRFRAGTDDSSSEAERPACHKDRHQSLIPSLDATGCLNNRQVEG